MPKVSIIIVNYNGKNLIKSCLEALANQTCRDFETIIIDNNSADESLQEIRKVIDEKRPFRAKLIPLNRNLGFTGGNIEGLNHAGDSKYIALLNNDTEAAAKWLEELVKVMDEYPDVGICASKLITYGKNIIDSAGDGFSTYLKGFKHGEFEESDKYNQRRYVFGACAGAALYRRAMLDQIGFLDNDFFLIHEDTDFNFRAQLAGWKVMYVPTAIVHHKVRSSIGHMSDLAVYYTMRNSEIVRIKNIPASLFLRYIVDFIVGMIAEFIYFALVHKKLKVYLRAKRDFVLMLPDMLRKRKEIMKTIKVDCRYIRGMMTSMFEIDFLKTKIRKLLF